MLTVVWIVNRTRGWYEGHPADRVSQSAE